MRQYVFGHIDDGAEPLELAVMSTRPSQLAMMDMVAALLEIKAAQREEKSETAGHWTERVAKAADEFELRDVAAAIKRQTNLDIVALEQLAGLVQAKFKALEIKLPISTVRTLVGITPKGKRLPGPAGGAPGWAKTWCFITDCDSFFDLATQEKLSERGFNARYQRNMKP